jgi:general secretion pathway protein D
MTRIRLVPRRIAVALAAAGLFATQMAHAQVTLNFVNADIDQVAKAIGAATGKTIIVDPRVKGQLNLVSEHDVPEDEAVKTLQSALRMQGFALVEDHGVFKVVPEADAKLQGVPTYVGNRPQASGDQVITQVFELRNESANNLLPVLRPLISPNNTISAYPANNTIIVTDYADNVRRIAKIIAGVDGSGDTQVRAVPLKNADAIDVAAQLGKLLDPGAIGNTDATLKVTVTADSRTNSVLLRASNAERLDAAANLVHQLDAPTAMPGNMHVIHLRNADAALLAKTLRGMMGKGSGDSSSASSNDANSFNQNSSTTNGGNFSTGTSGTAPLPSSTGSSSSLGGSGGSSSSSGGLSNAGLLGGDKDKSDDSDQGGGMIQADTATNSLIITASDPVYRNLRAVIDQLDVRRAQVYIEALIVELNSNTGANLGIQWQVANNSLYAGSTLGSGGAANGTVGGNGGNNIVDLTAALASGATGLVNAGLGNGLNVGWLRNMFGVQGLGGLIQAFAGSNDANVLSTPNLITLDNQEAKIVVGQNVPIATGSYSNLTSSSSSSAFNTYDRVDVGLILHVKPQITQGGLLKLQLYTEDSAVVSGTTSNTAGPTFTTRSIQSTVLCDNGQIIVLGGLMQDNYQVSNNKVPLLGDIPWIGQLFRSESKSRTKTNLMVFLRPVIISDGETADAITANRYDYVQGVQGAYKTDNRVIYDKDDPVVPPMPGGPRQGVKPEVNLFNLDDMRREQNWPPKPAAPAEAVVPASSVAAPVTSVAEPAAAPAAASAGGTATVNGANQ